MYHRFKGKRYRIIFRQFSPSENASGWCSDGTIEIDKHLKGELLTATLLHEGLHASFPDVCEESIEQAEADLIALLKKFGCLNV